VTVQIPAFSGLPGTNNTVMHNSVTETVSSQSTPVERREVLAQFPKKVRTSVNIGIYFAVFL
jgi:hypothetical protein